MGDATDKRLNANGAYAIIAGCGGAASVLTVLVAMRSLTLITDTGMVAIALMAIAPAAMAVGVAYFVHRTAAVRPADPTLRTSAHEPPAQPRPPL